MAVETLLTEPVLPDFDAIELGPIEPVELAAQVTAGTAEKDWGEREPAFEAPIAADRNEGSAQLTLPESQAEQPNLSARPLAPVTAAALPVSSVDESAGQARLAPDPIAEPTVPRPASEAEPRLVPAARVATPVGQNPAQAEIPGDLGKSAADLVPQAVQPKSEFVPRLKGQSFSVGQGAGDPGGIEIASQLVTRIDGRVAGEVDFKQDLQSLKVRIGSIVELLKDGYGASELKRFTQSSAGDVYLSIAQLQEAGIPITYDPVYDEFNIGSRDYLPTAAHKVQIDQIGRSHRETGPIVMEQIPR